MNVCLYIFDRQPEQATPGRPIELYYTTQKILSIFDTRSTSLDCGIVSRDEFLMMMSFLIYPDSVYIVHTEKTK